MTDRVHTCQDAMGMPKYVPGSKVYRMRSPVDVAILEWHTAANANDLEKIGWSRMQEVDGDTVCDACRGIGTFDGDTCWHCDGEGLDPVKTV